MLLAGRLSLYLVMMVVCCTVGWLEVWRVVLRMFGMFARSRLYQNLTPWERAMLRVLELVVIGALLAGYQAVQPLLNGVLDPSLIPWPAVLHTFLAAVGMSVASGALKYAKAFGDPPLPPPPAAASTPAASTPAASTPAASTPAAFAVMPMPPVEPAGGGAEPVAIPPGPAAFGGSPPATGPGGNPGA